MHQIAKRIKLINKSNNVNHKFYKNVLVLFFLNADNVNKFKGYFQNSNKTNKLIIEQLKRFKQDSACKI